MNDKIDIQLKKLTKIYFVFLVLIGFYVFIISLNESSGCDIFFSLTFLILIFIRFNSLYLSSAIRLIIENDTIELKLPFRKSKIIHIRNIYEIKTTNSWTRYKKYYCIKYIGGSFNTYFMSTENVKQISTFVMELQRRVEEVKKEGSKYN